MAGRRVAGGSITPNSRLGTVANEQAVQSCAIYDIVDFRESFRIQMWLQQICAIHESIEFNKNR
jgi:hypothetical protein